MDIMKSGFIYSGGQKNVLARIRPHDNIDYKIIKVL